MKRLLMKESWNTYAQKCVPRNAPGEQRRQLRKAFYAGAFEILGHMMAGLTDDHEPVEEDLVLMDDLYNELTAEFTGTPPLPNHPKETV
jgi:hypothetical protein